MKNFIFAISTFAIFLVGKSYAQCQGQVSINGKTAIIDTSSFSIGNGKSAATANLDAQRCGKFVEDAVASPRLLSGLVGNGSINSTDAIKICRLGGSLNGGWMFVDRQGRISPKRGRFSSALNQANCASN
jgi:hypothetical protein